MSLQTSDQASSIPMPGANQHSPTANKPPHQIFGNYAPDGTLLPPDLPPGPIFSEDTLSWGFEDGLDNDQGDMKRRRIARACDMCRKKKIKCDAKLPKCSHCESYSTECVFTHVEKKRAPPKGAKYIEGLENRLGRMEQLLRLSGVLEEDEKDGGTDLGTLEQKLAKKVSSRNASPSVVSESAHSAGVASNPKTERRKSTPKSSRFASPKSAEPSPITKPSEMDSRSKDGNDVDDLADMMWCSLVTNNHGETRFVGSSSGFSIFSPKGVQWVSEKTGDNSFHEMIAAASKDDNKWYPWREEIFGDIFARRTFKQLPPYEDCLSLIGDFFQNFNQIFPLFHEPTFMHLVDKQYSSEPYDGSGWWASLNVALAIAYRIRAMTSSLGGGKETEEQEGWGYFKNALAVLAELTLRNTDLLSVQALIGMSLFLQGTPNPQPTFYLIGAAVRLAHSIGLHKHGSGFGLNEAEIEQRKRVFWIAYLIDKDICLRSGRPPAQDDDDWSVDLPSENPEDGVGAVPLPDGTKTNLFRTMCKFAVICSQVYNRLYSVKAARQSDGELLNTIGELDAALEEWKDSIPIDLRPEHEMKNLPPPLVLHVVVLHFAYYNCLTTIHRRSVHHGYWSSRLSDYAVKGLNVKPLNPRVFSSAALCVSAARTSIHLINYIPPGDYACVWLILYYPISALVTLFANILQNPQDARARADLRLMNVVVSFLSKISLEESTGSIQRMFAVSREFERIAGVVLDRAENEMTTRQRKKHERERERLDKGGALSTAENLAQHPQAPPHRKSFDLKRPADAFSRSQLGRLNDASSASSIGTANGTGTTSNVYTPDSFGTSDFSAQEASFNPLLNDRTFAANACNEGDETSGNGPQQQPIQDQNGQFRAMGWLPEVSMDPIQQQKQAQPIQTQILTPGRSLPTSSPQQGFSPFNNTGSGFPSEIVDDNPGSTGAFQQPFVPQDLWQMPMTFEWDWADMYTMPFGPPGGNGVQGMGFGMGGPMVYPGEPSVDPMEGSQDQRSGG